MPTNSTPPIRVLLITARADLGGGPRHVLDLINAFSKAEVSFFIASPEQEPFAPLFRERCARFLEIPSRKFSLKVLWRLSRFVREEKIELIHSHGRGAGLYSRLLGLICPCTVLHSFHGIHAERSASGRVKLLLDQILAFLPFTAIFSSNAEHRRAVDYHVLRSQAFTIIHNAVDLTRFSKAKPARTPSPLRVGVFLRADPAKGPDLWLQLINSFLQTDSSPKPIVFTCAGVTKDELSKFGPVPESLEVAGPLKNPVPWLESLDLFVSTSRSEGLPLGVLEAMAAKVPCLLSQIASHQIFFDRGAAHSFDPSEPTSFSSEISELLAVNSELATRAEAARRWVSAEFSLGSFHDKLLEIYRKVRRSARGFERTIGS